jgi:hypothetical protein
MCFPMERVFFFDKLIRLTRTELIFGLGGMSTSEQTHITINTGFQLDFVMSEKFSWKVEFINYYPPSKDDVAFFRLCCTWTKVCMALLKANSRKDY